MLFSSLVFLFTFLPITLLVYYLVPRKVKNVVLLIASLIFYAWGEPVYIFLMLISILFNYFCGMDIALKAGRKSQVRSLIFTIVVNLFILGFFKYYGFIVTNLNAILPFYIPYRKLELPIGISFYTFQTLSYIIDVYRGNVDVQVNLPMVKAEIMVTSEFIGAIMDLCQERRGEYQGMEYIEEPERY